MDNQQKSSSFPIITEKEMINARKNRIFGDLAGLCRRLIECSSREIDERKFVGSSKGVVVGELVNGSVDNGKEPAAIINKLRELAAAFDSQFLQHKAVDPRTMWASTFCSPVLERPDLFEMSIFGFRFSGCYIPLHDHPKMFGFIRPLRGRIRVSSYSWLDENEENKQLSFQRKNNSNFIAKPGYILRPARYEGQVVLSPPTDKSSSLKMAILEPSVANLHTIEALDDGATFFDLLVPGYNNDKDRTCFYYNIISDNNIDKHVIGDIMWLEGSEESPEDFTMQRI
ncbi:hypothetical protein Mgra_00007942 [Meloidogyne graminicola]|uniref:2-aminoethanethiol dioxygenase n=1 Tax=Meloidogyne graminicola TaxID=189291 RepID=A0A8S9ZH53_9BILA|nr:hypothetical protein Mgra_00007942 [Meloidogyne graminicola]